MKYREDFRSYLLTVRKSARSNEPYNTKVVGDILRRCVKAEQFFGKELSPSLVGTASKLAAQTGRIRAERFGSTEGMPYAHLSLISAVKIYSEFLLWRSENCL